MKTNIIGRIFLPFLHIVLRCKLTLLIVFFVFLLFLITVNYRVKNSSEKRIYALADELPKCSYVLILGAKVYADGNPCSMLKDRLLTGNEVFKLGKAEKIIISGNSTAEEYDEVSAMKKFLIERGVPDSLIIEDNFGTNTYNSLYNLKQIADTSLVVIATQKFHMERALYYSDYIVLNTIGINADRMKYKSILKSEIREVFARLKAYLLVEVLKI